MFMCRIKGQRSKSPKNILSIHLQPKYDKIANVVSTQSANKHTCCRAVPCLEDGRPKRLQTIRAVMAIDDSAAPQPPNRLRPAETNQRIPVYGNTWREQLAKIKPIGHKHLILDISFVIYKL